MRSLSDAVLDAVMQGYSVEIRPTMLDGKDRVTALSVSVRRQEMSDRCALTASRTVFLSGIVPATRGIVLAVEVDDAAEELKNALTRKDRLAPDRSVA